MEGVISAVHFELEKRNGARGLHDLDVDAGAGAGSNSGPEIIVPGNGEAG